MRFTRRARTMLASTLLAVAAGCAVGSFAVGTASANTPATPSVKASCRINFQASSLHLRVGQDLVLTWVAVGADKLTASWTSGYVPFAGAVTTTMNKSGTYAYEVTGTNGGSYCGSAGVQVAFAGGSASQAATSSAPNGGANSAPNASTAASTSDNGGAGTNGGGSNGGDTNTGVNGNANGAGANGAGANGAGANGAGANGGASNGVAGVAVKPGAKAGTSYPRQSPTSGTGVPWYRQPMNLLAIGALALVAALALLKREPLRATIVHRH